MSERSLGRTKDDLSAFLMRHRMRLAPDDVGLPATGRRRTPGLRREEVAALAGVGLTWYTWFEQGRDIKVSEAFLLNVARALRLDDAECSHLFLLAHRRPPPPEAHQRVSVSPLVQQMMDELSTRPAYVVNLRSDVIAWNAAADSLFDFSGIARESRNILRMVFTDPLMRLRLSDWRDEAPKLLEQLRYDLAVTPDDPLMLALVEDLKALSIDFRRWWQATASGEPQRGIALLTTAKAGKQAFRHETLVVDEHRHLRMVVYFLEPQSD